MPETGIGLASVSQRGGTTRPRPVRIANAHSVCASEYPTGTMKEPAALSCNRLKIGERARRPVGFPSIEIENRSTTTGTSQLTRNAVVSRPSAHRLLHLVLNALHQISILFPEPFWRARNSSSLSERSFVEMNRSVRTPARSIVALGTKSSSGSRV